jgi:BirA family biotin operon repressor/biotin-[acetyl-CoA-carboxylase] ligase
VSGAVSLLDEARLRESLAREPFVRQLVVLPEAASTNDVARELAASGAKEGAVVIADRQSAGRGRRGRTWHSPAGLGLYISVLLRPTTPAGELTRWTLGGAVAACAACREATSAAVEIRWPNDLIHGGRKLGGVLAEARSTADGPTELVLGVGLNVGHGPGDFPDDLSGLASSLALAGAGRPPSRESLAVAYLRELAWVSHLLQHGEWETVARWWERMAPGARGQRVLVLGRDVPGSGHEGVTEGLDVVGALRVRRADGCLESVRPSESVRPLEA